MPTRYNPVVVSSPRDDGDDLEGIAADLEKRRDQLLGVMERECLRFDEDGIEVEFGYLCEELFRFALACNAMPSRTPRKLMATVAVAKRFPADFLRCTNLFDPEAVVRIIDACAARSEGNKLALLNWEIGVGAGPPPEEIRAAAETALDQLSRETTKGRPRTEHQRDLALALGRRFVAMGGKITRVTFDGETGPFHRLLKVILVPTVKRLAREAGFVLTPRSMVEFAQKDLKRERQAA